MPPLNGASIFKQEDKNRSFKRGSTIEHSSGSKKKELQQPSNFKGGILSAIEKIRKKAGSVTSGGDKSSKKGVAHDN